MQDASPDLLVAASRLAQALGQRHVVIIGGLAAFARQHGVSDLLTFWRTDKRILARYSKEN